MISKINISHPARLVILCLSLGFSITNVAATNSSKTDKKLELVVEKKNEEYKSIDFDQFKDLQQPSNSDAKFKVSTSCKTKSGVEYKSNDAGFSDCMKQAQEKINSGDSKDSSSMNFTLGN